MAGQTRITHNLPGSSMLFGDRILEHVREGGKDTTNNTISVILERARKDAPIGPPLRDDAGRFRARRAGEVHPGFLRRSGKIDYRARTRVLWAQASFNTPYAADQHESVHYFHPHGGKAKYLEDWMKAYAPKLEAFYALGIWRNLNQRPLKGKLY